MRNTLILVTLLSGLFGALNAAASEQSQAEKTATGTPAESAGGDIPWTWEEVDD